MTVKTAEKKTAKTSELDQQLSDLLAELRHCWYGQPGRALEVAEEMAGLLPAPSKTE